VEFTRKRKERRGEWKRVRKGSRTKELVSEGVGISRSKGVVFYSHSMVLSCLIVNFFMSSKRNSPC